MEESTTFAGTTFLEGVDFELGEACSVIDPDCEACQ